MSNFNLNHSRIKVNLVIYRLHIIGFICQLKNINLYQPSLYWGSLKVSDLYVKIGALVIKKSESLLLYSAMVREVCRVTRRRGM